MTPTPAQLEAIRQELGLNDPHPVQFLRWIGQRRSGSTSAGRCGRSSRSLEELRERLPATLALAGDRPRLRRRDLAPARHRLRGAPRLLAGRRRARSSRSRASPLPQFWLGLLLMYLAQLQAEAPADDGVGGAAAPRAAGAHAGHGPGGDADATGPGEHAGGHDAASSRGPPTPRGCPSPRVLVKHILRPALIPVVTLVGLQFGFLFGGAVVVETIFSWPGPRQVGRRRHLPPRHAGGARLHPASWGSSSSSRT